MLSRMLSPLLVLLICEVLYAQNPNELECQQKAISAIESIQTGNAPKDKLERAKILASIESCAKLYPDNWVIRYGVGVYAIGMEDLPLATENLKIAYEKSGGDAQVGMGYMLALKLSKKTLESVEVAKALAKKNPRQAALQIAYTAALMGIQKYDEAYPILVSLSKLKVPAPNEDYAVILASLGECQLYLGKHGEASISLTEALKHIPNAARFMVILGEVQMKSGKFELAKANLDRALGVNSSYDRALYLLGLLSEKENPERARLYYQKALEEAEKGMKIASDNGSEHYMLYQIYERLGLPEKAEEYKKSAAELHFTHEAPWKPGVKPIP